MSTAHPKQCPANSVVLVPRSLPYSFLSLEVGKRQKAGQEAGNKANPRPYGYKTICSS